ncbi:MAG: glycosyltransferase [Patescibacteria group bacterium]
MRKPKISVLMPVYNSQKYLSTSIESILSQTFRDFEFIIVDDGSVDDSLSLISDYKKKDKRIIVLHSRHNVGTSRSLNKGLSVAKSDYIVRMDADDWSYPNRLRTQYEYMKSHPKVGVSGGSIEVCDKNLKVINKRKYPLSDDNARKIIFCYSPFAHSATIWNTEMMKLVGGYNENIPLSQDCELYFKIGRLVKFGNVDATLIKLRTHRGSSSISKDVSQERYAIYSRIKGIMEYGYPASFTDKLCILGRIIAMIIVPTKIKFWLFNFLRGER